MRWKMPRIKQVRPTRKKAESVHKARLAAAKKLDKAVAAELAPLKLDAARFLTAVGQIAGREMGVRAGSTASNS